MKFGISISRSSNRRMVGKFHVICQKYGLFDYLGGIHGFLTGHVAAKIISHNLDEASSKEWNIQSSVPVMKELLEQKVRQVPQFQSYLLNSAQSYLMESTRDVFWGIGLKRDKAAQCAIDQLPGHSVLGWLLMALRDDQSG